MMKRYRIFDDIFNKAAASVSDFLAKVGDGESVQLDVMKYAQLDVAFSQAGYSVYYE